MHADRTVIERRGIERDVAPRRRGAGFCPTRRRTFLLALSTASLAALPSLGKPPPVTLLAEPLRVQGDWGKSLPASAAAVVSRMREACLTGVRLLSDRQPRGLWVENRASGPPNIWLHDDPAQIGWIVVDIGTRDWCKLAYQFGHELGHVLANSWSSESKPRKPCQWLEEDIVEAFSLRGLGKLAESWEQHPLFNDAPFAASIRQYRDNVIDQYDNMAGYRLRDQDLAQWFRDARPALESQTGLSGPGRAAVPAIAREWEADARSVEDIGALNRWEERSGAPIEQYLRLWERSCGELGATGRLPRRLADLFGLSIATDHPQP